MTVRTAIGATAALEQHPDSPQTSSAGRRSPCQTCTSESPSPPPPLPASACRFSLRRSGHGKKVIKDGFEMRWDQSLRALHAPQLAPGFAGRRISRADLSVPSPRSAGLPAQRQAISECRPAPLTPAPWLLRQLPGVARTIRSLARAGRGQRPLGIEVLDGLLLRTVSGRASDKWHVIRMVRVLLQRSIVHAGVRVRSCDERCKVRVKMLVKTRCRVFRG